MAGFPTPFYFCLIYHIVVLQPPLCRNIIGLGCFPFARHYSGNHYCFLFLCLLRCFSSAGLRIIAVILQITRFPHSEICGSIHICWSPQLIAAYHVLHRLWEPRHPPCTLSYFLLLYRLLLDMYAFLVGHSSLCHWSLGHPYCYWWLLTIDWWLTTSLLLSSLSIYFFQYVKELIRMCRWADFRCADDFIHSHICISTHLHIRKWRITDSNRWPSACKADALASWANPPLDSSLVIGALVIGCPL